jgi:hypothetical protein
LFQFVEDLHDAIAAHHRVIKLKAQRRGVLQHDGLGQQALEADAFFGEGGEAAFLLVRVAEDADEDGGGFQIARALDVVDGDQANGGHVELAANGFANRAFQQFTDSFLAEAGHRNLQFSLG